MAITNPTIVDPGSVPIARQAPWAFNNDEDNASTAQEMVATPGIGYSLYLKSVTFSGRTTDVALTLQDEDATVLFGPIQMQADGGGNFTKNWKNPLRLVSNKALDVKASGTSDFTCYVEGFTAKDEV